MTAPHARALIRVARKMFGGRAVRRNVQGSWIWMPWRHCLPDYAVAFPRYGQSLVAIAAEIDGAGQAFTVIDVGANIGDSALQVRAAAPFATVLCIEADATYLPYLRRNASADDSILIEHALLAADETGSFRPVRSGGTTSFMSGGPLREFRRLDMTDLTRITADLPAVRVIKSDTDGYDTRLITALATTYSKHRPIMHFEYDERLSVARGHAEPAAAFDALAEHGYVTAAAWTNRGDFVATFSLDERGPALARLRAAIDHETAYYDIAVAATEADRAVLGVAAQITLR